MLDLNGQSLLITGGTGSLGKALTAHIIKTYPNIKRLVIYSRDEQKQFEMAQDYPNSRYPPNSLFYWGCKRLRTLEESIEGH